MYSLLCKCIIALTKWLIAQIQRTIFHEYKWKNYNWIVFGCCCCRFYLHFFSFVPLRCHIIERVLSLRSISQLEFHAPKIRHLAAIRIVGFLLRFYSFGVFFFSFVFLLWFYSFSFFDSSALHLRDRLVCTHIMYFHVAKPSTTS